MKHLEGPAVSAYDVPEPVAMEQARTPFPEAKDVNALLWASFFTENCGPTHIREFPGGGREMMFTLPDRFPLVRATNIPPEEGGGMHIAIPGEGPAAKYGIPQKGLEVIHAMVARDPFVSATYVVADEKVIAVRVTPRKFKLSA